MLVVAGKVTALDSIVDQSTRNVQVQATFPEWQRSDCVRACSCTPHAMLGAGDTIVALPASAISYAPYGDSVFVVDTLKRSEGRVRTAACVQRFVKLGGARGDQVAVLSGVKPGEEIVTSGLFKLRNGAAIQVNNSIQPSNSPTPKVEDR